MRLDSLVFILFARLSLVNPYYLTKEIRMQQLSEELPKETQGREVEDNVFGKESSLLDRLIFAIIGEPGADQ